MSIIEQFTNSLWNFGSYRTLSRLRSSKSFLYIFLLFTLIYIVFSLNVSSQFSSTIGIVKVAMEDNIPNFSLSGGRFYFDGPQPYRIEEQGFAFIIDTTGATMPQDLYETGNGILITATEMAVLSAGSLEITPFSNIPFEITKDQVMDFLPNLMVFVYIFLIVWYFVSFAGKLIGILVLTLITMIANSIFNQRLTFGNLWNIAIYASTLPMLLKMLHSLLNSPLTGLFFFIYWGVAITYSFLGVYYHSKDEEFPEQYVVTEG
jgi:hypothetical protein